MWDLPVNLVREHIAVVCNTATELAPLNIDVADLETIPSNTLIRLDDIEFKDIENGQTFANFEEETTRTLQDCRGDTLTLVNSGFSDFQNTPLPTGSGSITGILQRQRNTPRLRLRTLEDVDMPWNVVGRIPLWHPMPFSFPK